MNTTTHDEISFKHWHTSKDIDGVLWLSLDRQGESANSLSTEVLSELGVIVDQLEAEPPAGLVLQSGKPGTFIVGADVREFDGYDDVEAASDGIRQVHRLFNRIEALPFPKVVIIDGYCLGGGVELSLAFDYRIASDVEHTRLGFPEIKLGIYPGFGGSARSVHQVGASNAMQLMLSTRNLRPVQRKPWAWSMSWWGHTVRYAGPHAGPSAKNARAKTGFRDPSAELWPGAQADGAHDAQTSRRQGQSRPLPCPV